MSLEALSGPLEAFLASDSSSPRVFFPQDCGHPEPQGPSTQTPTTPKSTGKQLKHNHTKGFKIFLDLFLIRKEASNPTLLIRRNILG